MGEATKGKGFSSSLVYALISACGTIVRVKPEKISTGTRVEIHFYTTI